MTTKPRVKKFRIRRAEPLMVPVAPQPLRLAGVSAPGRELPVSGMIGDEAGAPNMPAAGNSRPMRAGFQVDSSDTVAAENDMDAIRQEGLTGRQLRMARRVAQKHGLAVTSDFDAVRQLRAGRN